MNGDAAAIANLKRFYAAESAYLLAAEPDFGPVAATLDRECVIYQPASLPYGGIGAAMPGSRRGCVSFTRSGLR